MDQGQVFHLDRDIEQIRAIKANLGPEKGEGADSAVFGVWKPTGMSTFDVIRILKKEVGLTKIGHGGTLDPLAEGVVVIGVGRGTKEVWKIPQDKVYRAEFLLGQVSESLDVMSEVEVVCVEEPKEWGNAADGESSSKSRAEQARSRIEDALQEFVGEIEQMPPKFSAKKVNGKRAYELARAGATDEEVGLKSCQVEVYSIELIDYAWPKLELRVHCGKGTYIRSLGDDIARVLGVQGAVMSKLVRMESGGFGGGM